MRTWIHTIGDWFLHVNLAVGIEVPDEGVVFRVGVDAEHLHIDFPFTYMLDSGRAYTRLQYEWFVVVKEKLTHVNSTAKSEIDNIFPFGTVLDTSKMFRFYF